MNKNKRIIIIVGAILAIAFIAFAFLNTNKSSAKSGTSKNSIKIYVSNTDTFLKKVLQEYKSQYPNVKVEEVYFSDLNTYRTKLTSEIMGGEGPDIIFFNSYTIGDINKIIRNGVFADLKPFINNNKDFELKDYNEKLLEVGKYNGKLFFIPVSYSVDMITTTSEILKKSNIDLSNSNLSQKEFLNKIESYISSIKDKNNKYIFSDLISTDRFINGSGLDFIDYEKKKTSVDSPEFEQLIKDYKKIYKLMAPLEMKQKYKNQEYDMLKSGDILFNNSVSKMRPGELLFSSSFIKKLMGESQLIYALPQYKGGNKYVGFAENCIAINNNSKSKDNAFNFINIALSAKMQSEHSIMYIPVNNTALDLMLNDRRMENKEITYNEQSLVLGETPKELKEKYYEIINNVEKFEFNNLKVAALMETSLRDYFEDKISYEKAISDLKNKLTLYLNE